MDINLERISHNKWYLDVRVKRNGKEKRKRVTFDGTKDQAICKYYEIKRNLESQPHVVFSSLTFKTFGDLLQYYRRIKKGDKVPSDYESRYKRLLNDLGNINLEEFPNRLHEYIYFLRTTPSPKTNQPMGNSGINRLIEIVVAVYNFAFDSELITKNPINRKRFPKLDEIPRDRVLSDIEKHRLMQAIEQINPQLKYIFQFAIQVPCRKSELVNMKKSDLDLNHNAIRVKNGTTKNGDGIWKPIPPDMISYFRSIPEGCTYLFYRCEKGEYFPLGDFKRAWKRSKEIAQIEDYHFHDTRHDSASELSNNGTPEQVIMEVAGWKTNMLRHYYHQAGKRNLHLVRFGKSGHSVDTTEDKNGENGLNFEDLANSGR